VAMPTVILVAATTGYQTRSFGEAAAALGVELRIASDRCGELQDPWWDRAIPVRFHDVGASVAVVREALSGDRVAGVVAVGDRPAVLGAHLAEALGCPGHPPGAAAASRDKVASRAAFARAGLPTPAGRLLSIDARPEAIARDVSYPAVVKPVALSGSRGVMRVDDAAAFVSAFERLRRLLHAPDVLAERDPVHRQVLIESYVDGPEFAVEGIVTRGHVRVLAIFDKPDPLVGPFFEETIYVTPSRAPSAMQARIAEAVGRAARALGLGHGPFHAECRVSSGGVCVLEVAARPIGGLCAAALRFVEGTGPPVSLERILLRHAIGEDLAGVIREPAASGVMMIPIPRAGVYQGVRGEAAARQVAGIEDLRLTIKPQARLVPLPEGRSYLGFLFARATDPAAVEQALRQAHACLTFEIGRALPVA
jgi:formate-dependent phosphoribosylglycinamide formyltransferase (GAR transformylase)